MRGKNSHLYVLLSTWVLARTPGSIYREWTRTAALLLFLYSIHLNIDIFSNKPPTISSIPSLISSLDYLISFLFPPSPNNLNPIPRPHFPPPPTTAKMKTASIPICAISLFAALNRHPCPYSSKPGQQHPSRPPLKPDKAVSTHCPRPKLESWKSNPFPRKMEYSLKLNDYLYQIEILIN